MNEKPILFSGPMVKAILEGRKTQTRRVISRIHGHSEWLLTDRRIVGTQEMLSQCTANVAFVLKHCPYGQPGDHLWVRETWNSDQEYIDRKPSEIPQSAPIYYKADVGDPDSDGVRFVWRPSIFMPRWASRITLEITGVRVERVQDITSADALAEGIDKEFAESTANRNDYGTGSLYVDQFAALWDAINAKRGVGWKKNPWVWVIEFKMTEGKD